MTTGFPSTNVLLLQRSGQDCLLPDGFVWNWRGGTFRHKPGGHTDGMSSPQFLHFFHALEPYGWALPAAIAHDAAYHGDMEQLCNEFWKPFPITKDEADLMLLELLEAIAKNDFQRGEAKGIFGAVQMFGHEAWTKGHAS